MNKRIYDANPLPPAVRRVLGAAAAVAAVGLFTLSGWTAGPGNWVPPLVRDVAEGRRTATELPRVVVTARRGHDDRVSRADNEQPLLVCDDGSVPVARGLEDAHTGGNLQP